MTLIRRDPFARVELHRTEHPRHIGVGGCEWCGGRNANGKLYEYREESDGGRTNSDGKLFCSLDCREVYYS